LTDTGFVLSWPATTDTCFSTSLTQEYTFSVNAINVAEAARQKHADAHLLYGTDTARNAAQGNRQTC
jgi:hypothetical protein